MKKLKELLVDLHPEVLDSGRCLLEGHVVEFGTINNARLRKAVIEHHAAGQRAMADFIRWLVRREGLSERTARMVAAEVWNALCVTWSAEEGVSHPEELWRSGVYATKTLDRLVGYMRRWSRYVKDPLITAAIDAVRLRDKASMVTGTAQKKSQVIPYTRAELDALLDATEKLRGDPRWPWGWPLLRLVLVGGLRVADLLKVTRSAVRQALAGGPFLIWTPKRGTRALPTELIRDELEFLDRWPFEWGGVVDLVSPRSVRPEPQVYSAIHDVATHVFELAGVEMFPANRWIYSCCWSAALRYYSMTGCVIGAAHILGTRNAALAEKRLREIGERQRAREKALAERGRRSRRKSVVVDEAEAEGGGDERQEPEHGGLVADEAV